MCRSGRSPAAAEMAEMATTNKGKKGKAASRKRKKEESPKLLRHLGRYPKKSGIHTKQHTCRLGRGVGIVSGPGPETCNTAKTQNRRIQGVEFLEFRWITSL